MKKLLPVVISGVMAISFSQFAAAQKADVQGPAGTGANVDLNSKGSTAVQNSQQLGGQNQSEQQSGTGNKQSGAQQRDSSATTGATGDSSAKSGSADNSSSGASKSDKMEGDSSSAGASQSYSWPAEA